MSLSQASWPSSLVTFGLGLTVKKSLDYLFDYLAYPAVLIGLGYAWGSVVMTISSIVLNLAMIRAYDWAARDLLLLEALKDLRAGTRSTLLGGPLGRLLRHGDVPAFIVLSWIEDAAVVTLYLRKGSRRYDGLTRRDWWIFAASTVLSNLFWTGTVVSMLEAVRLLLWILPSA